MSLSNLRRREEGKTRWFTVQSVAHRILTTPLHAAIAVLPCARQLGKALMVRTGDIDATKASTAIIEAVQESEPSFSA
jgi:hypothetical protein